MRRAPFLLAWGLLAGLLLVLPWGPLAADGLKDQVEDLARRHRFQLLGADVIADAPERVVDGDLDRRLAGLLDGFNHMILRDAAGRIETVRVTGLKGAAPPDRSFKVTVRTQRRGTGHFLEAVVMGQRPVRKRISMMVDTGASMVILPTSMMADLGFAEDDLHQAFLQTANGEVLGYTAKLRLVEVGRAIERDVPVAFVDDLLLGDNRLLGMSYLGRYVITVDDAANTLSLQKPE